MKSPTTGIRILPYFIIACVVLFVFGTAVHFGIVPWDDTPFIFSVPEFQSPSPRGVWRFWERSFGQMYLPVTYTLVSGIAAVSKLFPLSGEVSGLNPHIFHLVNLVFHAIISIFVFQILRLLLLHGDLQTSSPHITIPRRAGLRIPTVDLAALCGTLLYVVHPVQVEPVVWISGIKDLSYGLFAFPSIFCYLLNLIKRKNSGETNDPFSGKALYLPALLFFMLAILAKPAAVMVPVIIWLLAVCILRFPIKIITIEMLPWFVLSVPVMAIIMNLQSASSINYIPPLWSRPFLVGDTIAYYLYKLFVPIRYSILYNRIPENVLGNWWGYLTWLIPFGLLAFLWLKRTSLRWVLTGFLVFIAGFFPVSGLVTFVFQNLSAIGDRYLYLSMLGPAIVPAWLVYKRPGRKTVILVLLVICLLSVRSRMQVQVWGDPLRFLKHTISISNHVAFHRNLGKYLMENNLPDQMIDHFENQLTPKFNGTPENRLEFLVQVESHLQLGYALSVKKKADEAKDHYKKAAELLERYVKLYPGDHEALLRVGNAFNNLSILTEDPRSTIKAIGYYHQALREEPNLKEAHYFLASIFSRLGKPQTAISHLKKELEINPLNPRAHYDYGLALHKKNKVQKALIHFETAASLFPTNPLYKKTLTQIRDQCLVLNSPTRRNYKSATDYYNHGLDLLRAGKHDEAISSFKKTLSLDPAYRRSNYMIAVSYRKKGLLPLAITHYRKELEISPDSAEVHNDLGIILCQTNQPSRGLNHIRIAASIDKKNPVYKKNLEKTLRILKDHEQ